MCLGAVSLMFPVFGICGTSWNLSHPSDLNFVKFRKIMAMIASNMFSVPFHLTFKDTDYPYIGLETILWFIDTLHFLNYFFSLFHFV